MDVTDEKLELGRPLTKMIRKNTALEWARSRWLAGRLARGASLQMEKPLERTDPFGPRELSGWLAGELARASTPFHSSCVLVCLSPERKLLEPTGLAEICLWL